MTGNTKLGIFVQFMFKFQFTLEKYWKLLFS